MKAKNNGNKMQQAERVAYIWHVDAYTRPTSEISVITVLNHVGN